MRFPLQALGILATVATLAVPVACTHSDDRSGSQTSTLRAADVVTGQTYTLAMRVPCTTDSNPYIMYIEDGDKVQVIAGDDAQWMVRTPTGKLCYISKAVGDDVFRDDSANQ
jgi:hypothetical protein